MEKKFVDPDSVYQQSLNKQRIVITGAQGKEIAGWVIFVLNECHRDFGFANASGAIGLPSTSPHFTAPVVIILDEHPDESLLLYHHHILVISDLSSSDTQLITRLADATPKSGVIIYSTREPALSIGKKERNDCTAIPFDTLGHITENGRTVLVSSTKEKFPVHLSGPEPLRSLGAAKGVLKKIGITSRQYYTALGAFQG